MKKALLIIFISLLVLFLPALSGAEIREGSIEISPFVGYCTGATSHDLCHKDVYGLRLGYALTQNWVVEGAYEGVDSSAASMFHADVLYHFMPEKTFNPFIIAGAGIAHVRPIRGGSYDTFMGDIGVGFKYWLTQNIAFRSEIRDVMTHSQNSVVTAGLTFTFGGKTPKSTVIATPPAAAPQPVPEVKAEPTAVPAAVVPPPPPPAAPVEEPVKIILEDIHFDFDKATLTNDAKKILARDIAILKENQGLNVQIEGHTCAHGSESYNMALGERRANAVKEFLANEGIAAGRMTTISYGETRLAMPEIPTKKNKNSREAKANRRVHFSVFVK